MYSNGYVFINAVVIVFILCSGPVYCMSSFVFGFQFDLILVLSCVLCVICCYVYLFMLLVVPYCITATTGLTTHLQSNRLAPDCTA
jgi:hypothetical protein